MLVEAYAREDIDTILLAFLDSALELEEMYDQIKRDEWNDWVRIDYWDGISANEKIRREGSARLLQVKSELYRAISFLSLDVLILRQLNITPVRGEDVLAYWRDSESAYFLE